MASGVMDVVDQLYIATNARRCRAPARPPGLRPPGSLGDAGRAPTRSATASTDTTMANAMPAGKVAQTSKRLASLARSALTRRAFAASFGAPRPTAVLAVLGYRIVNYWLPLLPGAVAYTRRRLSPKGG
jgi:hypothetical protein